VLRLPATHIRSLICFASGVHVILLASCFATCAPGRVGGDFRARAIVQPATQTAGTLARGRERDLPGSQTIHPVPLPRSATPAEPTIPRLFDGLVDAAPALPTARASALNEFRGSITRLWHLLPTLQDWCCHHPCKARFRLAGSPLPGGSRTLRIATKGFRSQSHPPFLDLSWRKGSFILNLRSLHIIRSPRRRARAASSVWSGRCHRRLHAALRHCGQSATLSTIFPGL
jgi:hypothetical protein